MMADLLTRSLDRGALAFLAALAAIGILVPVLNLTVPESSPFYLSSYFVALFGQHVCLALLALSIDLIWGYCGILSLGHGAFFALGGYAMGMYLMRQIGTRGVYAHPVLPDFMVFLNWPELPVYWYGFQHFAYAAFMVVFVPGLLAFVFGWFAFRSRVTGVYLSIITQALTFALMLGFFRNNFGFGGNNGLTDFKDILSFNVQAPATRAALFVVSALALMLGFVICRVVVSSKFGKVLVAIRDAEARTRFLGYRVEAYKLLVFTLSACMAGVAGALYVPQVGIINPSEFSPGNSIEAVIWVAVGGRGTLTGAVLGAVLVNYGKTYFTSGVLAPYWLFVLGGLFVAVTLLLPGGTRTALVCRTRLLGRRSDRDGRSHHHGASLPRRRDRVVRRLPRAQQPLLHHRARRDACHHRSQRRRQDHHDGCGHRQDQTGHRGGLLRRRLRSLAPRRDRDRAAGHRPQVPEADRLRHAHGRGQYRPRAEGRPARAQDLVLARERRRGEPHQPHPRDHPVIAGAPPRGWLACARPEAVARDRHATGARAQASSRRRAGCRDDRRRDAANRRAPQGDQSRPHRGRGGARYDLRARARSQGHLPARRFGAGGGHHRPGLGERARGRGLSGALARCCKSTPLICITARRRRCATCRSPPSPAR